MPGPVHLPHLPGDKLPAVHETFIYAGSSYASRFRSAGAL
jgi:hypothetical protein